MIDQLRREAEVGRSAMVAGKRIQTVRRDLEQHLMRAPTAAEMAEAFAMSAEEYFALEKNAAYGRSTSLDAMLDGGAFLIANEIGRTHVRTPVTNAQIVCRLRRAKTHTP